MEVFITLLFGFSAGLFLGFYILGKMIYEQHTCKECGSDDDKQN